MQKQQQQQQQQKKKKKKNGSTMFADAAASINHNSPKEQPEAHGPQRSPECTAMKAIFSQNTVIVACKKK